MAGSSPRVWGTPGVAGRVRASYRFIPTGVGNTACQQVTIGSMTVHPHGCGEHRPQIFHHKGVGGTSPRVWGPPPANIFDWPYRRFIPTGVGNTARAQSPALLSHGSSPRVWGTPPQSELQPLTVRFIPTGVGNTQQDQYRKEKHPVHPHGCGEHGSSPEIRLA